MSANLGKFLASGLIALSLGMSFAAEAGVTTDLNGDTRSDILYRNNSTGQIRRLLMNGFTVTSSSVVYTEPDVAWRVIGDADFNGDGIADLLWKNDTTGAVFVQPFSSSGSPNGGAVVYTEPNPAWQVIQTPDLNSDGKADLLFRNSATGQLWGVLLNGTTIIAQGTVYTEPNLAWKVVASGDLAGSGKRNQLLWRNSSSGDVYLMTISYASGVFGNSGVVIHNEPDPLWKIVGVADFNGDGKGDILWRHDSLGQVHMQLMNGPTIVSQSLFYTESNLLWKIVAQGDYNGDGKADILYRNSSTGELYMMQMNGFSITAAQTVTTEPDLAWRVEGPLEYKPAARINYVHTDHLGTPRAITRPSDNKVVWRWENSEPFGNSAPNENPSGAGVFSYNLRFPGQYYDVETGTHYNYYRDYDPSIGRYMESDPIGLTGGLNTYAYVRSPLTDTDPLGQMGGGGSGGIGDAACKYYDDKCKSSGTCLKTQDRYACAAGKCCRSFRNTRANKCTRKCLIDYDQTLCTGSGTQANCRYVAHYVCYSWCANTTEAENQGYGKNPSPACLDAYNAIGGM